MRSVWLHLRNAIIGGLSGLAAGSIAVWAIAQSLRPAFTEDDYPVAMSGAYVLDIFLGTVIGLVVYLTLTRRDGKAQAAALPMPEDPQTGPPPPTKL